MVIALGPYEFKINTLKIALALEGLLIDIDYQYQLWQTRQGGASSYMDEGSLNNESFWAALKPAYEMNLLNEYESYVLTKRPPKLFMITRSWLRRHGVQIADDHIIMKSWGPIKRYDCRLLDLDYYLDNDLEILTTFKYDKTIPVGVGVETPTWIRNYSSLTEVRFEPDMRDWKCFQ